MKIHKEDQILVISGKDKGRKGKVIESLPKKGKIAVEGINLKKKHVKPKKSGDKGQIVTTPALFDVSDVKLICSKCGKAVRIEYKIDKKIKQRICKKCKGEV
ncbi:MAG: 50S ribosomal protein L24 [Candidatus Nealsonbacteria bacterium]